MARAIAGLSAAGSLLAPAPLALAADHVYAGTLTSPSWSMPHGFVIETRGRRITRMTMQWGAECNSGYYVVFHGSLRNSGRIGKAGRFKAVLHGSVDIGSTDYLADARTTISGVLTDRSGSGSARATTVIERAAADAPSPGDKPDVCHTGLLRWRVARGPGIFGGATAQGEPLVATVQGRRVKTILLGWRADGCSGPGTWWDVADSVANFDISSEGVFGDSFSYSEDEDGGGSTVYGYNVHGQVAGRLMSGTFGVAPRVTDAAGQSAGGCSTPDIAWKARSA